MQLPGRRPSCPQRDPEASAGPSISNTMHDPFQFVADDIVLLKICFIIWSLSHYEWKRWDTSLNITGEGSDETEMIVIEINYFIPFNFLPHFSSNCDH